MLNFLKTIIDCNKNTIQQNFHSVKNLIIYYFRLKRGLINKTIFVSKNNDLEQTRNYFEILNSSNNELIKENIKKYLNKIKIVNKIDFSKKSDFLQVGMNTLFIHEPIEGLWTTGKATFYLPIIKDKVRYLKVEIFSVIPTKIIIGQEKQILKVIKVKEIQTKVVSLLLNDTKDNIVEIFIESEKRWWPNIISKRANKIPIGVNIKSISIG